MKNPTFIYYLKKDSIFFKIPIFIKIFLFLAVSIFTLVNKNYFLNIILILFLFMFIIHFGFYKDNKKPFIFLLIAISIFSILWIFLSKIPGDTVYVSFFWGTFLSNKTIEFMLLGITKWSVVVLSGILFMIISSEQELIKALLKSKISKEITFSIALAFNTVGLAIRDLDVMNYALLSRNYVPRGLYPRLKQILYVGGAMILSNIKKIDTINQSYILREKSVRILSDLKSLNVVISYLRYEKKNIIKKINFVAKKGEIINLFGKTGSGKTTLLKAISGIIPNIQKEKGSVEIFINKTKVDFEDYRKYVSFSFQEAEDQFLFNDVLEELFFNLNGNEIKSLNYLIKKFRIGTLLEKSPKDLSTGQRKLVSLINTLSSDKPIFILDEPTANLSDGNKKIFLDFLKKISKNKIILIATHDLFISKISDKFLLHQEKGFWKKLDKRRFYDVIKKSQIPFDYTFDKRIGEPVIQIKKLSYWYPDKTMALSNVSLNINKGDIVGLFGDNGSGKTTLINLITKKGLNKKGIICMGKIKFVGIVHQEPQKQLFSNTVYNELTFEDKDYNKKEIQEILNLIELSNQKYQHPYFLSRGEKQLLLIASVLIKKPELIIIDEPFTGLDRITTRKIFKLIIFFYKKYYPTIILSSQKEDHRRSIKDFFSKKVYLSKGKIKNVIQTR